MQTRFPALATLLTLPPGAHLPVRLRLSAVALLTLPFLLLSCGDGGSTGPEVKPVAGVVVTPAAGMVNVGLTLPLSAEAKDGSGNVLSGRPITWSSSNDLVATVSEAGLVTGADVGVATISAACEGASGTANITVAPDLGIVFGAEQFVEIPAGTFQMGDLTGNGSPNELPVHTVNITRSFSMLKTEVTQDQWWAVVGNRPSHFSSCGGTCPVENVSWSDVQRFLDTLNARDPGKDYRLPTEAEWEYAARAGTTSDFAGTGVLNDMGWHASNSGSTTHPAGQKQPNAWGLYDMHGNVWEWVQDRYGEDYYSVSPTNDPQGPDTGAARLLRGGGWGSWWMFASCAHRSNADLPQNRNPDNGFRLVRNASAP
ncbi:MAG: SUMF1/EgtB/PvdO family nonheme iron enzyme [Gemmatimonadetes bacterium]|nr:SUMF1/EgtB/PvdO family nonheme iron enzyme [Gemmatimonadota bacterium]